MDYDNYSTNQDINNSLAKIAAIRIMLSGQNLTNSVVENLKGIQIVDNYLNSPINSLDELKFKKAFIAAVISSKEFGDNVIEGEFSTEELTMAVSEGLTRLKTHYLKGKGGIDENKAKEIELDHQMASLLLTVEAQIDKWCKQLPENLDNLADEHYEECVMGLMTIISPAISSHLSPFVTMKVMPIITKMMISLKPQVRQLIKQGSEAVIKYVRPEIDKAIRNGVVLLQNAKNWVHVKDNCIKMENDRKETQQQEEENEQTVL